MTASSPISRPRDDDGYRLWLRYEPLAEGPRLDEYRALLGQVSVATTSATGVAIRAELQQGLAGLLARPIDCDGAEPTLIVGTSAESPLVRRAGLEPMLAGLGEEGFVIARVELDGRSRLIVSANDERGLLYGAFRLLRAVAAQEPLPVTPLGEAPKVALRLLNHWDNLNGSVERGYAGGSLWDFHKLPDYVAPRYADYARANASIGINGTVLTNVNANALILTREYLRKVAELAEAFRPYGLRVFLTARFSAPSEIGGLTTADPADPAVIAFWRAKADEIYALIPDFGGLLVKANSEGQPGPQRYGRSHADGANLLAAALAPHGGVVLWRAFVYDDQVPDDRAKQALNEFQPLDGAFLPNVIVQVKNGPIDFQPREPFHPLFGAMPKTPLALEVQLTQEYLGCATHLCYLGPLLEECLRSDTLTCGPGSTVARVVDGSLDGRELSAMSAVANIGNDRNWCGHPFAQANWYAYGRFAWDHRLSSAAVAEEWLQQTFGHDPALVAGCREMMLASREAVVDYMTPLGLHHLMAWDHHYGPGPWIDSGRADWTSVYFHRADAEGLGFDRTPSGSDAVAQYAPELGARYASRADCPEALLLWFHHVPWQERLRSGRTLWDELCYRYQAGVEAVRGFQATWAGLSERVDAARAIHVRALLRIQEQEARWWRDACLAYFQTFSRRALPAGVEPPEKTLEEYQRILHHYVPGNPRTI